MPSTAANMLAQIGVDGGLTAFASLRAGFGQMDAVRVNDPVPLFARLDAQKVLEEIRSEAEAAAQAAEKSEEHPENIAFLEQILSLIHISRRTGSSPDRVPPAA